MKATVTYKEISKDVQKIKIENIHKIIANALKRTILENNNGNIRKIKVL